MHENPPTDKFPVVDLTPFGENLRDEARLDEAANKLCQACKRYGFVTITGHGVPEDVLNGAFDLTKRLFNLPLSEKMKAPHPDGPMPHRGYSKPGLEKAYSKDEMKDDAVKQTNGKSLREVEDYKESYEIGSEHDRFQQNIWLPEDVLPGYRDFMIKFYWECEAFSKRVLKALQRGLSISNRDAEYLQRIHSGHGNQLRLLHYPAIESELLEAQVVTRMPAHNDWGTFTFLFQDEVGGLELEDPLQRGRFMSAKPIPGSVVMNVGDQLQRMTNDLMISATHRVAIPQGRENGMTPQRYSIPYFVAPDFDATVKTLEKFEDRDGNTGKYQPFRFDEYSKIISKYQYGNGE